MDPWLPYGSCQEEEPYTAPLLIPIIAVTPTEEAAYFEIYRQEKYDLVADKFPLLNRQEVRAPV